MSCTNCFNGCEIVSDRCVKYSGIDIPELGIQNGDSLSSVEQSITTYLVSVLNGSGVKIDLTGINVCNTVQKYLPVCSNCTDVSIADISKALIKAACDLQVQIDDIVTDVNTINDTLTELNSTYSKVCLTGTINVNDTHSVLQAVIDNFCSLAFSLPVTYVSINSTPTVLGINDYIEAYLDSTSNANLISNRMVPYAVVEYYGLLTGPGTPNFGATGNGTGDWDRIFLCNGLNGTPDKRGVVGVGITDGTMLGSTMPSKTIPGGFNPIYSLNNIIHGDNAVTLVKNQMPAHSHTGSTAVTTIPPHNHQFATGLVKPGGPYGLNYASDFAFDYLYNTENTSLIATTTLTIVPEGQNLPHQNNQPALGCYYIQYRP
jgi:microcystin-dependent protein